MALEDIGFEDGNINESLGEVKEEDSQRVQQDDAKAKQVQKQIQQSQKKNQQFAHMLSLLLQIINDDTLLQDIFKQLTEYKIDIPILFLQFFPYIPPIEQKKYQDMYSDMLSLLPKEKTVVSIVSWLHMLRKRHHDLQNIGQASYVHFIIHYLHRSQLIQRDTMDTDTQKELHTKITKTINKEYKKSH